MLCQLWWPLGICTGTIAVLSVYCSVGKCDFVLWNIRCHDVCRWFWHVAESLYCKRHLVYMQYAYRKSIFILVRTRSLSYFQGTFQQYLSGSYSVCSSNWPNKNANDKNNCSRIFVKEIKFACFTQFLFILIVFQCNNVGEL